MQFINRRGTPVRGPHDVRDHHDPHGTNLTSLKTSSAPTTCASRAMRRRPARSSSSTRPCRRAA
jgi:hypothetical protein